MATPRRAATTTAAGLLLLMLLLAPGTTTGAAEAVRRRLELEEGAAKVTTEGPLPHFPYRVYGCGPQATTLVAL
ncbi:unnamed protein product [Miscanthus lutarioriparius]|uniref:Uncharacterized protein n=1 Tax=Miscanthus lutarioriparius TaxID=422564 RepID=A0A811NP36_9POAL|nr:unnamed protein product [Miscanthus lutarioriparius]